jgi:iduronate 2-sulfatase
LIHGYAACVTYIDAQVGLLMRTLEECGVAGNTVVCLWGDHGWHLGEHGHWGKLTNYEDAARVPLIVSAPGVGCGRRVGAVTESLDVFPTLCELAGLSAPLHVEGVSLVPLMRGTAEKSRDAALTQACHGRGPQATMGWSVRTPRHRYIEWRSADLSGDRPVFSERPHAVELYDYESDPEERENLATRTEFRTVLAAHQTILARLLPQRPGDGGGTRDAGHSGMPVP